MSLARREEYQNLLENGAVEIAPAYYSLIVALHAIWLCGLWILGWDASLQPVSATAFLVFQVFRTWILMTLGRRWTTSVIVVRNAALVRSRTVPIVQTSELHRRCGEIAVLPLWFNLPVYALVFSIAKAVVLTIRIRAENTALIRLRLKDRLMGRGRHMSLTCPNDFRPTKAK